MSIKPEAWRICISKAASHDNAACMQNLRRCMSCSSAIYIGTPTLNVASTSFISAQRSSSCDTMYQSIRSSIAWFKCAGTTGASRRTRSLLQQQAPLPEELTVQSFSDFNATQLRNVTAAQAAAASATAAASAAVAAVNGVNECCICDSAGATPYCLSCSLKPTTLLATHKRRNARIS